MMKASPKLPCHPIVRINYVPRIIGGSFMFAIMASIFYSREVALYLWFIIGFCLVFPHAAFQISKRSKHSKQTELRNMGIDAFFFGLLIPIAHFQIWVAMAFTNLLISNCIRIGGLRLMGVGFILYVFGILAGIGIAGVHFVPVGNTITTSLCILLLTLYFSALSIFTYNMTKRLVHSKKSLEKAHQDLKIESEERKRAMDARAELEQQLLQSRKMESIGTLTKGIAHHFNNILTAIIGNTELALDELLPSHPAYSSLEEIFAASNRAREIISQLSDFAHKAKLRRESIDLVLLIQNTMEFLKATITSRIQIRHHFYSSEGWVLADRRQIQQMLINLCTNAADAMEKNGGIINIGVREVSLGVNLHDKFSDLIKGNYIELTVEDTGHGIAPEILDRIFDPFFTTKDIGEGSGMGLSVVHGIAESHGGKVVVESVPEKGTIVKVFLPVLSDKPPGDENKNHYKFHR